METVIIALTNETHEDVKLFEECFHNDSRTFQSLFCKRQPGKDNISHINLDDVRGKVILISANLPTSIDTVFDRGIFYEGGGATHFNEDAWDMAPKAWPQKLQHCKDNIENAKADEDENHVYGTAWSMSNAVCMPPYNPIDFFFAAYETIVNVFRQESIGINGQHCFGTVLFDFYEQLNNETLAIIRSNPGCGNVQRN